MALDRRRPNRFRDLLDVRVLERHDLEEHPLDGLESRCRLLALRVDATRSGARGQEKDRDQPTSRCEVHGAGPTPGVASASPGPLSACLSTSTEVPPIGALYPQFVPHQGSTLRHLGDGQWQQCAMFLVRS